MAKVFKKSKNQLTVLLSLAAFSVVIVLILSSFSKSQKGVAPQTSHEDHQKISPALEEHASIATEAGSIPANGRVKFKIDRFKKLALQPLEFEVFDENKKALTPADLKTVHEQQIHLIITTADLKEYLHLHPTFEKGKWRTLANIPTPGTYYAYTDIAPLKGNPITFRSDLIVRNPTTGEVSYPKVSENLSAKAGPYQVQLSLVRPHLLQQTVLSFELRFEDAPVKNLQPYLGALGHIVIFRHLDPDGFMHVHPLASSNAEKGLVEFVTTFSKEGRYTAFAQFKLGGQVYTFPITFEIKNFMY
jgi:hypothetical protein